MSYTQEEKNEFVEKLKARTKKFALDVLKLYQSMPKRGEYLIIGNQLLRAATSLAYAGRKTVTTYKRSNRAYINYGFRKKKYLLNFIPSFANSFIPSFSH